LLCSEDEGLIGPPVPSDIYAGLGNSVSKQEDQDGSSSDEEKDEVFSLTIMSFLACFRPCLVDFYWCSCFFAKRNYIFMSEEVLLFLFAFEKKFFVPFVIIFTFFIKLTKFNKIML